MILPYVTQNVSTVTDCKSNVMTIPRHSCVSTKNVQLFVNQFVQLEKIMVQLKEIDSSKRQSNYSYVNKVHILLQQQQKSTRVFIYL